MVVEGDAVRTTEWDRSSQRAVSLTSRRRGMRACVRSWSVVLQDYLYCRGRYEASEEGCCVRARPRRYESTEVEPAAVVCCLAEWRERAWG